MLRTDILKKIEKITSATYLVTGFFDDKEPLKWKLRTISIDLISEEVKDKSVVVGEMLSLFSIAKTAGLISETNHNILVRELSPLEHEVENPLELLFLDRKTTEERALPQPKKTESLSHHTFPRSVRESVEIKDKTDKGPVLREFGVVSVKKNSRQSIIIAVLKRKKEIMIKDVSPLINGCSEKTIQRELLAMVQAGVLKKAGNKRWSRYSLV